MPCPTSQGKWMEKSTEQTCRSSLPQPVLCLSSSPLLSVVFPNLPIECVFQQRCLHEQECHLQKEIKRVDECFLVARVSMSTDMLNDLNWRNSLFILSLFPFGLSLWLAELAMLAPSQKVRFTGLCMCTPAVLRKELGNFSEKCIIPV